MTSCYPLRDYVRLYKDINQGGDFEDVQCGSDKAQLTYNDDAQSLQFLQFNPEITYGDYANPTCIGPVAQGGLNKAWIGNLAGGGCCNGGESVANASRLCDNGNYYLCGIATDTYSDRATRATTGQTQLTYVCDGTNWVSSACSGVGTISGPLICDGSTWKSCGGTGGVSEGTVVGSYICYSSAWQSSAAVADQYEPACRSPTINGDYNNAITPNKCCGDDATDLGYISTDGKYLCNNVNNAWHWGAVQTVDAFTILRPGGTLNHDVITNGQTYVACDPNSQFSLPTPSFTQTNMPTVSCTSNLQTDPACTAIQFGGLNPVESSTTDSSGRVSGIYAGSDFFNSFNVVSTQTGSPIKKDDAEFLVSPPENNKVTVSVFIQPTLDLPQYAITNKPSYQILIGQNNQWTALANTAYAETTSNSFGYLGYDAPFEITLPSTLTAGSYDLNITIVKVPTTTLVRYKSYVLRNAISLQEVLNEGTTPTLTNPQRFLCHKEDSQTAAFGAITECCGPDYSFCINKDLNLTRISGGPTGLLKDWYGDASTNGYFGTLIPRASAANDAYRWQFDVNDFTIHNWNDYDTLEFDAYFANSNQLNISITTPVTTTTSNTNEDSVIKYSTTGNELNTWHHIRIPLASILGATSVNLITFKVNQADLVKELGTCAPGSACKRIIVPPGCKPPQLCSQYLEAFALDRIFLSNADTKYCRTDFSVYKSSEAPAATYSRIGNWTNDLDKDKDACNNVQSFHWTGTQCCGDDERRLIKLGTTSASFQLATTPSDIAHAQFYLTDMTNYQDVFVRIRFTAQQLTPNPSCANCNTYLIHITVNNHDIVSTNIPESSTPTVQQFDQTFNVTDFVTPGSAGSNIVVVYPPMIFQPSTASLVPLPSGTIQTFSIDEIKTTPVYNMPASSAVTESYNDIGAGCWQGQTVPHDNRISFSTPIRTSLIFFKNTTDSKFRSCNATQAIRTVLNQGFSYPAGYSFPSQPSLTNPNIKNEEQCKNLGKWYCDVKSIWSNATIYGVNHLINSSKNTTTLKTDADFKSYSTLNQGKLLNLSCCPSNFCFNGTGCENSGDYIYNPKKLPLLKTTLGEPGYRCNAKGKWINVTLKYDFYHNDTGYCTEETDCYADGRCLPDGNWSLFNGVDRMCINGHWTTRTKYIATAFQDYVRLHTAEVHDYVLYCDDLEHAIGLPKAFGTNPFTNVDYSVNVSNFNDYVGVSNTGLCGNKRCVNGACVLEIINPTSKKVIIGTSLNLPLGNKTGELPLYEAFGFTKEEKLSVIYITGDEIRKLFDTSSSGKLFYSKNKQVVFYTIDRSVEDFNANILDSVVFVITNPLTTVINFVKQVIFGTQWFTPILDNTADFDKLFFMHKNGKAITAIEETKYDQNAQHIRTFISLNYTGFTANICPPIQQALTNSVCQPKQNSVYVFDSNLESSTYEDVWPDLTAKLRP